MDRSEIIQSTAAFIAREFASEGSGHDWFQVDRVRRMALLIAKKEGVDLFVTELAALLHDLDDYKISGLESHVPVMHDDFQSYKGSNAPTINHFYEKLLLLKDRMNTNTAKLIAEQRHRFMENYLQQFFDEWEAKG